MPFITDKAEHSSTPLTPSLATSSTSSSELAVTITFGLCAVVGTAITLWQAHRLWRMFSHNRLHRARAHEDEEAVSAVDVELASVGTATADPAPDISTASSVQSGQDAVDQR